MRIAAHKASALATEWRQRFGPALQALRSRYRLLEEPAFVLPLVALAEGGLQGKVLDEKGRELVLRYDAVQGLSW
ncbi:hypothetical protein D3C80_1990450 [compost metagenome]